MGVPNGGRAPSLSPGSPFSAQISRSAHSPDGQSAGTPRAYLIAGTIIFLSLVIFWATLESDSGPFSLARSFTESDLFGTGGFPKERDPGLGASPAQLPPQAEDGDSLTNEGLSSSGASSVQIPGGVDSASSANAGESPESNASVAEAPPQSSFQPGVTEIAGEQDISSALPPATEERGEKPGSSVAAHAAPPGASPGSKQEDAETSAQSPASAGASGTAEVAADEIRVLASSKCADACFQHGTCNEETGECHCVAPFGGKDCMEPAMPACQLAPNYFTRCDLTTTCECMVECEMFRLPITQHLCLRGTNPDGTKITNLTQIFDGPRYPVRWGPGSASILPPDYSQVVERDLPIVTSPEECPHMCSGFGWCLREHKHCQCSWSSQGEYCEIPHRHNLWNPLPCLNGCSAKGDCKYGQCRCQKGFFGVDCSLYKDDQGITRLLPRMPYGWTDGVKPIGTNPNARPKIYVYDLPMYFNTWQGLYSGHIDWAEPVWFFERVLNTEHRTADPSEADFFYIPLFIRNRRQNFWQIVDFAVEFVQQKWPFFNRNEGRDHFILTNGDWGNCELGGAIGSRGVLRNMFSVTLWGMSKSMHLEDAEHCFIPGRDVVIPPDLGASVYKFAPWLSKDPPEREGPRTILLYFRGFAALDHPGFGRGNYSWSFGVRQAFYYQYRGRFNETGILFDEMPNGPYDNYHLRQMLKSIFCFTPAGYGWGMRATQAVVMGCIPVVIQPLIYQAFEGDGLDWNEFGIRLEKKDIPNLAKILRRISKARIAAKRQAMERVRMRFLWSSFSYNPLVNLNLEEQAKLAAKLVENDAFAGVMVALKQHAEGKRNSVILDQTESRGRPQTNA